LLRTRLRAATCATRAARCAPLRLPRCTARYHATALPHARARARPARTPATGRFACRALLRAAFRTARAHAAATAFTAHAPPPPGVLPRTPPPPRAAAALHTRTRALPRALPTHATHCAHARTRALLPRTARALPHAAHGGSSRHALRTARTFTAHCIRTAATTAPHLLPLVAARAHLHCLRIFCLRLPPHTHARTTARLTALLPHRAPRACTRHARCRTLRAHLSIRTRTRCCMPRARHAHCALPAHCTHAHAHLPLHHYRLPTVACFACFCTHARCCPRARAYALLRACARRCHAAHRTRAPRYCLTPACCTARASCYCARRAFCCARVYTKQHRDNAILLFAVPPLLTRCVRSYARTHRLFRAATPPPLSHAAAHLPTR